LVVAGVAVLLVAVVAAFLGGRRTAGTADAPPAPVSADPVDVGFASDMYDHHQQALQMATVAGNQGSTTAVRTMAAKMIAGQQLESGRFLQFLDDHGLAPGEPDRSVMGWMGMARPHAEMPGLATPAELVALANATGPDVDRRFLDLMIRHHRGGIDMAGHEAAHGHDPGLRDLAGRMVVMQGREVTDMELLQRDLGGPEGGGAGPPASR
jgi:uncharacterized protein (DUF305 family)